MENKYFTPEITDIRVGYEAEFNLAGFGKEGWKFVKFKGVDEAVRCYHEQGFYRTPYLTKEQIEAEGWQPTVASGGYEYRYKNYYMFLSKIYNKENIPIININIENLNTQDDIFQGECKDINTFRYICKLLNIQ